MKNSASVLYVATYPPRECGIATFTRDLVAAVDKKLHPAIKSCVLAMNRNGANIYNYPPKVIFQLNDVNLEEYICLAKKINKMKKIKLVCVQHEFGIFGGDHGSYLSAFLEVLDKPSVITFHSIVPNPNERMKSTVQFISQKAKALVVMSEIGREILRKVYGITTDIFVIPHGIPYTPLVPSQGDKNKLGFKDKLVISSFGMLNSGKGYEYVIDSLPKVVKKFPNLLYVIVGETHPVVRKKEGEKYRNFLEERVKKLGLQKHVKFYNKYVTLKEIVQYLRASDVYVSSGLDQNQITSGTLAYAMGCGRPVISTPFLHAIDAVKPEDGILVKFKNSESFKNALIKLLSNPDIRTNMGSHAYHTTRNMTWENVAAQYEKVFRRYIESENGVVEKMPKISFNHLVRLTDDFGVIQFAKNVVPDLGSGYALDDVARALIVCSKYYERFGDSKKLEMMKIYLNFMKYIQDSDGKFYNTVDRMRNVNKKNWAHDAHGRAVWALGYLLSLKNIPEEFRIQAKDLFEKSMGVNQCINSPRAMCFLILGYHFYNLADSSDSNINMIRSLADSLVSMFKENITEDWKWFEQYLTYDNSKFPEALFYAYLSTKDDEYLKVAEESIKFLTSVCFEKDVFAPIGQRGWYVRNSKRAYFDQQPIEASSMVEALLLAGRITGDEKYSAKALRVFYWFLGKNVLGQALYNEYTGGCYDGLGESSININQGAESTLSYLLARLAIEEAMPVRNYIKHS